MTNKIDNKDHHIAWARAQEWGGNTTEHKPFNPFFTHYDLGFSVIGEYKKPKPFVRLIDYLIRILYKIRGQIQ